MIATADLTQFNGTRLTKRFSMVLDAFLASSHKVLYLQLVDDTEACAKLVEHKRELRTAGLHVTALTKQQRQNYAEANGLTYNATPHQGRQLKVYRQAL